MDDSKKSRATTIYSFPTNTSSVCAGQLFQNNKTCKKILVQGLDNFIGLFCGM
jgi:hypothetical protein